MVADRVALPGRNRNAGQAAEGWQLATLDAFQQAVLEGAPAAEQVSVVREGLPEGVALRLMRGIATEPGCLACHGAQVAPAVRTAIAAHYPDDAATGFRFEEICAVPAFLARADDPAVRLAQHLAGTDATTLVGFGTEAGLFQHAGIASVVCGPGFIDQAHQADEFVSLEQLARCEAFMQGLVRTRTLG